MGLDNEPACVELQIALCIASVVLVHSLTGEPEPPRLMLATAMSFPASASRLVAVAQSIPQMICDQVPPPFESSTLAAKTFVSGATPTRPEPLLRAAIEPAT